MKQTLSAAILVVAVSLLFAGGPWLLAPTAAAQTPVLILTPSSGPPNTTVQVRGTGFQPGIYVAIDFGGDATTVSGTRVDQNRMVDSAGTFMTSFSVYDPAWAGCTMCPVKAVETPIKNRVLAASTFTFTASAPPPTPMPTPMPTAQTIGCSGQAPSFPAQLTQGEAATFYAWGFEPGTVVTVSVTGMAPVTTPVATSCQISLRLLTSTADPPGPYTITATGPKAGGGSQTATATFQVRAAAALAPAPPVSSTGAGSVPVIPPSSGQTANPGQASPNAGQSGPSATNPGGSRPPLANNASGTNPPGPPNTGQTNPPPLGQLGPLSGGTSPDQPLSPPQESSSSPGSEAGPGTPASGDRPATGAVVDPLFPQPASADPAQDEGVVPTFLHPDAVAALVTEINAQVTAELTPATEVEGEPPSASGCSTDEEGDEYCRFFSSTPGVQDCVGRENVELCIKNMAAATDALGGNPATINYTTAEACARHIGTAGVNSRGQSYQGVTSEANPQTFADRISACYTVVEELRNRQDGQ